jgi:hypothetical protein
VIATVSALIATCALALFAFLAGRSRGRVLSLADLEAVATKMAERVTPQVLAHTKAEALELLATVFHDQRAEPGSFAAAARVTEHLAARFRSEANKLDDAEPPCT